MAHQYIVSSKDVEVRLTFPGIPSIKIETGTTLNLTWSRSVQEIFAISYEDPIDVESLNAQYTANLSFQTGEYHTILDIINGALPAGVAPYATLGQLPSFTLSKSTIMRNAAIPKTVTESLMNCKVETNSADTNRNEVETLSSISLRGVGVRRTVSPIT